MDDLSPLIQYSGEWDAIGDRECQIKVGPPVPIAQRERTDDCARNHAFVGGSQLQNPIADSIPFCNSKHATSHCAEADCISVQSAAALSST